MVMIFENEGSLSEEDIVKLEKKLKFYFPKDYRSFLLEYNGGYPEPDSFNFFDGREGADIQSFFGISKDVDYDILKVYKNFKKRIPNILFPIACDSGGNLICIGIKDEFEGKIYFWDHEKEKNVPDFSNITLISNSFNIFLNSLYEI